MLHPDISGLLSAIYLLHPGSKAQFHRSVLPDALPPLHHLHTVHDLRRIPIVRLLCDPVFVAALALRRDCSRRDTSLH